MTTQKERYYYLVENLISIQHQVCPACSSDEAGLPCYCELWEEQEQQALLELKKYHNEVRKELK